MIPFRYSQSFYAADSFDIEFEKHIAAFYGTTENAVKLKVWTAIFVYVLVAILKKTLKVEKSLYTILQILSITLFEKMSTFYAITNVTYTNRYVNNSN